MLEITRLSPQICWVERIMFATARNKFTKAQVIQRLMKEQKQCFGALLETKSQKEQRMKREKKGVIVDKSSKSNGNSELSWALQSSKTRVIRFKKDPSVELPATVAAATKVVLVKSAQKHQQASLDAAESVLQKLRNPEPSGSNEKIIKCSVVKKKIIQKKNMVKDIPHTPLFYEEEAKGADILHGSILSISRTENEECLVYPSVTKILNATMSNKAREMLELWMARMIEKLGQEGFAQYKADLLENGNLLHSAIENSLRKIPVEVPQNLKDCFDSLKNVLDEVENVKAIESHVVHPSLGYRGVVDCVASFRGNVCLIDWKKSDRTKDLLSSTYDAPLQIASYVGALNADKNYPFQIKSGLLVIAYTIGKKPTLHSISEAKLQYYWKQWLARLKKYQDMQNT